MTFNYLIVDGYERVASHTEHEWGRYNSHVIQTNSESAFKGICCIDRKADVVATVCDAALTGVSWSMLRDYWLPVKRIEVVFANCGCLLDAAEAFADLDGDCGR